MGVPVKKEINPSWSSAWRDVHQVNVIAFQCEIERQRPIEVAIAVSADDQYWLAEIFQRFQAGRIGDIAEMPNLVCHGQFAGQMSGQPIVGI